MMCIPPHGTTQNSGFKLCTDTHTQFSNSVSGGVFVKGTFWQMMFLVFTVG